LDEFKHFSLLMKKKGRTLFALSSNLAERTGLEPATPGVTGRYSNQLNYRSNNAVLNAQCLMLNEMKSRPFNIQHSTFTLQFVVGAESLELPTFAL
jgi:hypothetical protein